MAFKYKPTRGRVLVKPLVQEEKTKGGIYLPDTATKEKPQEGEVIAVGEDAFNSAGQPIASPAKAGQKVLYAKWGGEEYKDDDGVEYKFIKFDDIIAVMN
ncbi:MAG: 10 kDa chaperonin [Patescibacteria group bacterium]|jgi:chaperonin GroES|nr:MAG: 10 kDa chaperonin [Patescibacteria group bacterium]